ncbi:hypothetical protein Q8F55_000308 [Vanrija albida]|uniref:Uncharacterized protein n=1 Tax=Vanrija albida TaxID=181172 RepID=A0ABR3QDV3_9TREE
MVTTRLVLAALVAASGAIAGKGVWGDTCSQANSKLDSSTWALSTDCGANTYCDETGHCVPKGCRQDLYPLGYSNYSFAQLPPLCPQGQFCPDEGDRCLEQSPFGGPCQKDRDDQCQPPPNSKDLAGYLNVNGSICLNFTYSDAQVGQTCVNENTLYTGTNDDGVQFAYIVSRDNCRNGYYCDGSTNQCMKGKNRHQACSGNKECISYNCQPNGTCGKAADEPLHTPAWVYAIVGIAIVALIVGVMTGLWFLHRRSREEHQVMLEQYYNEQIAYRQSIMSMSHAKNSLLSLPQGTTPDAARASLFGNEDSAAYSTAINPVPPNMQREVSAGYSDENSVLMMDRGNGGGLASRFRR